MKDEGSLVEKAGIGEDVLAQDGRIPKLGLRERNKRSKELLIRKAARTLFVAKGFDSTTLREIAEEADVGFGTVFSYAKDKAGLLAMVFVEELNALPPLFPREGDQGDVLDTLVEGLGHLYAFWASMPSIAAQAIQHLQFYVGNPHVDMIIARRAQALRELRDWLERLRAQGRTVGAVDPQQAADTLFAIYNAAVRDWSVSSPGDVSAGKDRLRSLMALPVRGLTKT